MAQWERILNLLPEWKQAQDDKITVQEMAKVISQRLAALTPFEDEDIEETHKDLANEFEILSEDDDYNDLVLKFDYLMDELYDWGDLSVNPNESFFKQRKVCWVKTF